MVNLGICKKCNYCGSFDEAIVGELGEIDFQSKVCCDIASAYLGWEDDSPDKCPYKLEHVVTGDYISDFSENDNE